LDLQSLSITTKFVGVNPAHGKVHNRCSSGTHSPIKLTSTIWLKYSWKWR